MRDRTVLLLAALVVLAPVWGGVVVTAQQSGSYAVAQGTTCTVVEPVTDTDRNVSEFYDYRNPLTEPSASTYSSYGTQEYQETATSTLLFYAGAEGANLVVLHDELGDEAGGSTLTMSFDGLPADGEWAVEDDDYPNRDDDWVLDDTSATVDWKWGPNRTDGGAYSGVGDMQGTIVITPGFNEEAAHWGDWGYSAEDEHRMEGWRLLGADGSVTELDRDRRVFVHSGGCEETPPEAALTGPASAEAEETVTLDASGSVDDGAIGGYEWDLDDDGEIDQVTTEPTLDHAFSLPGDQTVTVTAFDTYGNADTASLTVNVTVPPTPPSAALDAPELTTVNESITLDASGSLDEGSITGYEWDFDGDGEIDAETGEPVVDHTYTEAGTVEPTVAVIDDDGERDTATATVEVRPPNQPPNASLDAPAAVDEDTSMTFDAGDATDDRGIAEYRWDFDGDGEIDEETDEPTVEHAYETPGNYTATVRVVDTDGEIDAATATVEVRPVNDPPTAALDAPEQATVSEPTTFDASGSTDEEGIAEYRWDFDGDGQVEATTDGPVVDHSYENTTTGVEPVVTVVDDGGLSDTATATLDVLPPDDPPTASLDAPANATAGEPATFDASNASDDRGIETYRWDFDGDGEIDEETDGPVTEYVYEQGGTFDVSVTVVDTGGQTASASATTTVIVPPSPPTAQLEAPETATVNRSVTLDASGSSDEGTITEYRWDVDGDGEVDRITTDPTIDHTYTRIDTVEPVVTVVDDDNETDTVSTEIAVEEFNPPPTAALDAPAETLVDEPVTLDASGSTDEDGIAEYRWDFDGDGEIDEETDGPTVEHTFINGGQTTVDVVVVGDDGQTATTTATIAVGDPDSVTAAIGVDTDEPTAGEPVALDAADSRAASGIASYEWTFGDDTDGSGAAVEHSYSDAGEYQVTLTITSEAGLTANATRTVTVAEASNGGGGNNGGGNNGGGGQPGGGGGQPGGGGQAGGGQQGNDPAPEPDLEPDIGGANVTLGSQSLLVGETLVVEATVTNRGNGSGTKTVEFEVEGEILEEREVPLQPNESRTVAFSHEFTSPGEKRVEVDHGRTRTVVVRPREPNISVTALAVDEPEVRTGEEFTVTANVTNIGDAAGEGEVSLGLFGDTVASRTVSLSPGESTSVSFTRSVMAGGSYDATVGNESVTVTVVGDDRTTEPPTTTTESPGFGPVSVLVAVAMLAMAVLRRRP